MFFLKQYLEKHTLDFSNIPAITRRCTNTITWIKYKEIADKYILKNWHSTKYQAYSVQNIKGKKEKVEEQLQNRQDINSSIPLRLWMGRDSYWE